MGMGKGRLEAFSDGVMAIIITIMVLELKVPHSPSLDALWALWPVGLSYLLSFVYVGIYWNNHHHLLHAARQVDGKVLWANLHLLFWLSLLPFATGWLGENHFAAVPCAFYGLVLLACAIAYWVLQGLVLAQEPQDSPLRQAFGQDWKGKGSIVAYALGMAVTPWSVAVPLALYVAVALMWLVPDRRIERHLGSARH